MSDVYLYIYDLSKGISNIISWPVTGRHFEGIWHTSVFVYDIEYFFGRYGVWKCKTASTPTDTPIEIKPMGRTDKSEQAVKKYILHLSTEIFKVGSYDLFKHNCNNFSEKLITYLTGESVPPHIRHLPLDFLQTSFGFTSRPIIEQIVKVSGPAIRFYEVLQRYASGNDANESPLQSISKAIQTVVYDNALAVDLGKLEFCHSDFATHLNVVKIFSTLRELASPDFEETIGLEDDCLTLLHINNWFSLPNCISICDVYRVAVLQSPTLILTLLTDPLQRLHELADAIPIQWQSSIQYGHYDLDMAKARLLCNIIAASRDWNLMGSDFIPLAPVVRLSLRLTESSVDRFRLSGVALALNLTLCPALEEKEAVILALNLFSLVRRKIMLDVDAATYLLRGIFCLLKRFPDLRDKAISLSLTDHLPELLTRVEDSKDDGAPTVGSETDRNLALELTALLT